MTCLLLFSLVIPAVAWQVGTIGSQQTSPPPSQTQSQQQPQEAQQAEKKPARIEGSVVLTTGVPVRKAQLLLFSSEQRIPIVAVSDAAGKFLFEKVPPGDYNFNVNHSRFTPVDDNGAFDEKGSYTLDLKLIEVPDGRGPG